MFVDVHAILKRCCEVYVMSKNIPKNASLVDCSGFPARSKLQIEHAVTGMGQATDHPKLKEQLGQDVNSRCIMVDNAWWLVTPQRYAQVNWKPSTGMKFHHI